MRNWIGGLLADLVKVNHVRNEPLRVYGHAPIHDQLERETHAAASRLEGYRH